MNERHKLSAPQLRPRRSILIPKTNRMPAGLSRRQFVALTAGIWASDVQLAALADPPRPEGKIAYVRGDFGDGRNRKIWIMQPDGSKRRALTDEFKDAGEDSPCWSPDGRRILFSALRGDHRRIYVRDSDGKNEICLTPDLNLGTDYESPMWSPDAKTIAFYAFPAERKHAHICLMTAEGTNQRQLTRGGDYNWLPCFSPDGKRIVFETTRDGNREIYVMNVDGSNPLNLSKDPQWDHHPACSPDGSRIAFMSRRDRESARIYVMNSDGSEVAPLTKLGGRASEPAWSPCGNWLAFTWVKPRTERPMDIYIMRSDGSDQVNLTKSRFGNENWAPNWGPN